MSVLMRRDMSVCCTRPPDGRSVGWLVYRKGIVRILYRCYSTPGRVRFVNSYRGK